MTDAGPKSRCGCPAHVSMPQTRADFEALIALSAAIRRNLTPVKRQGREWLECRYCGSKWVRFELPERLPIPVYLSHTATRVVRYDEVQAELANQYRQMAQEVRNRVYAGMDRDDAATARRAWAAAHPERDGEPPESS